MHSDKREFNRLKLKVIITISSNESISTFCSDISESGIFVETHKTLEIGKTVEINLRLPYCNQNISFDGIVRWQRSISENDKHRGIGIEIEFISKENRKLLNDAISIISSDNYY